MGLFPVDDLRGSLSLLLESVEVTPRPSGCDVRRLYRIRCKGSGGPYRLATALLGPDHRAAGLDSVISVYVDGQAQDLLLYDGGLVDAGGAVRIEDLDERAIQSCWERGTGEICGHTWAEATVPFRRNEVREVEIIYQRSFSAPDSSLAFAVAHAGLYTESFWSNQVVSRIEIRLDLRGLSIPAERLEFAGAAGRESIVDYRNEGGVYVARVRNYRGWKEPGLLPERLIRLTAAPRNPASSPN